MSDPKSEDEIKAEALAELAADEPPPKLSPFVVHKKKLIMGGIGATVLLLLVLGLLIGLGLRAAQRVGMQKQIVGLHVSVEDARETAKGYKEKLDEAKASRTEIAKQLEDVQAQLASAVAAASEAQAALAAATKASTPAAVAGARAGEGAAPAAASGPQYLRFGNGNCVLEVGAKKDPISLKNCMAGHKAP
ncbi:hypothetical protein [Amantichitinum ursilacus]|uniref:Uncharacterized protein n=1 Tax=Amantichitinum ursilacus TaxID=857265 RepID=A0A0N0XLG7_9NEIS|nr:hypothetical protein [Amantichitinum ursilacus]KPC53299.1 hypothetical protein WG78_09425 [Amantichitinum ursilacus]